MRHTKIVVTLGPATERESVLRDIIEARADVLRLNFSHGTHDEHARNIERARRIAAESGRTVALMQDLQGAKIRIASLPNGPLRLRAGARCVISPRVEGAPPRFSTTYSRLARDVRAGQQILLDDGDIELRVAEVDGDDVLCDVVRGGTLHERKGLNLPGMRVVSPPLTPKDRADLAFGLAHGIDLVALSFVRNPQDVDSARNEMVRAGRRVPVIAKFETAQALERLDAVLRAFDAAMVARGDLGAELPPEDVPGAQKRIIARANALGRPVITATQMLESMIASARPTRAEASDVANAVLDGTDAVMLSGETAIGKHPVDAVRAMDRIVRAAEALPIANPVAAPSIPPPSRNAAAAVCAAAAQLARDTHAAAIAAYTRSGRTAKTLSQLRPGVPIFALCETEAMARELALYRGVHTLTIAAPPEATANAPASQPGARAVSTRRSAADIAERIAAELRGRDLIQSGDSIVVVGAAPGARPARTNFIRLLTT